MEKISILKSIIIGHFNLERMISGVKNRWSTRQTSVPTSTTGSNYGISKNTRLFCSVICKYNSFSEAIGFIAAVDDANKDAVILW
jgi:hypothetical protein